MAKNLRGRDHVCNVRPACLHGEMLFAANDAAFGRVQAEQRKAFRLMALLRRAVDQFCGLPRPGDAP